MYKEHPVFVQPENEAVKVWRYMDFTKLVSLVDSRCLFFSRADELGDPFEGSWPRINVDARKEIPDDVLPEAREGYIKAMENLGVATKHWLRWTAVNCWHMNDHESAAMWKLYLKSNEGIAVQSSYNRLRDSIVDNETVFLGVVSYIDYEKDWIDAGNLFSPFVHKRKSFEHEREVRALIEKLPVSSKGIEFNRETINRGINVKVTLERLVEKIYVAPSAPGWFADLVRAVIHKYGLEFEIVHSKLDEQPLF